MFWERERYEQILALRDHRPGGRNGHFVVSRNYSGTGNGSMKINVGMGSVDITTD